MELTKTKYKKTEVGMIPEDWKICSIEELARVVGGGTPSTQISEYWNGNIEWFTPTEIGRHKYSINSQRKITELGLKYSSAQMLPIGSILMTTRASIGDLSIIQKEACTNQGFQSIVSNTENDNEFLYYLLSTLKGSLIKNASGSTFLEVSPKKVKSIKAAVPPTLEEQKAIATALSDVDDLINNLEKLIAKKKAIKQGAMQQLLTPPHKGGKRLAGFSGEWINKQLGELAIYKNGKAHENCVVEYGDYIIVNSKFISTDGNVAKYSNDFLCPVNANEILMVLSDVPNGKAIAKCFIVDKDNRYTLNQRICSLKPINTNHLFLYYLINRNPYFLRFDDGAKQTNLRNIDVLNCPLVIPPTIEEQDEIATIISDLEKEINQLEEKLNKSKDLKQGMMQELLTGQTRLV
jgi:type I restriction enzyme S subunit